MAAIGWKDTSRFSLLGYFRLLSCRWSERQAALVGHHGTKDTCDSFAKTIYLRAFAWLVRTININTNSCDLPVSQDPNSVTKAIGLLDIFGFETFDKNRFEQELIYYLEKLDINEEKVRLANHLTYFLQELGTEDSNGKKLGFISQEIGREINTIGSKSSDVEMQKIVVQMKDELEKIKEQLLNIL